MPRINSRRPPKLADGSAIFPPLIHSQRTDSLLLLQMLIREIKEHFPVRTNHAVLAVAEEVAEAAFGERADFGLGVFGESFHAIEFIDGARGPEQLELAAGIGPLV